MFVQIGFEQVTHDAHVLVKVECVTEGDDTHRVDAAIPTAHLSRRFGKLFGMLMFVFFSSGHH